MKSDLTGLKITESEIYSEKNLYFVLNYWENLYRNGELKNQNIKKLENYLKYKMSGIRNLSDYNNNFGKEDTNFRKMIVLLDNLLYNKNLTK